MISYWEKRWRDFYLLEEVISIPPLQEIGIEEEVSWKIAVRDTKRYDVAAVQGKRVVKAKYKVSKKKKRQKEKRRRTEHAETMNVGELNYEEENLRRKSRVWRNLS